MGTAATGGATDHKAAKIAAQLPPGKPEAHLVARLELTPVKPIPDPPANDDLPPPKPPVAQEPEPSPNLSKQSPQVAVASEPASPQPPAAKPELPPVARLELAPPQPLARPQGDVSSPKSPVANQLGRKPSDQVKRVATLPKPPQPPAPAQARGRTHLASAEPAVRIPEPRQSVIAVEPPRPRPPEPVPASKHPASAKPDFQIPDPPPGSLANLPAHLQLAASQKRKRAAGEPAFHIPDPPPLEPGHL